MTELPDGRPIQSTVSPIQAADLKRGVSETVGAWEKESEGVPGRVKGVGRRVYREIDKATDASVPGHREVNQKISSLLAAAKPKGKPQGLIGATLGTGSGLGGSILRYGAIPGLGYYEARRAGASMPEAMATGLALEGLNAPGTSIFAARRLASPATIPGLRALTLGAYNAGSTPALRAPTVLPSMTPFQAPASAPGLNKPLMWTPESQRRLIPYEPLKDRLR